MKKIFCCSVLMGALLASVASTTFAAETLEKKVERLEKQVGALQTRGGGGGGGGGGGVDTFLSKHISLGGFFEHAVTANLSKDRAYQLSANSHLFGVNLAAQINDQFRLVSQEIFVLSFPLLNEHNVTTRTYSNTATVAALVAHAYGEYTASEKFKIQTGLGWVPFGIDLASREFPLYLKRNGHQIAGGGLTMPFAIWEGLHVLGQFSGSNGTFGYDAYSATPTTNANTLGGGSRLWWSNPKETIKIGTSNQILEWGGDQVFNIGGDLELKAKPFGFRTEYARSITNVADVWTVYGEPYVTLAGGKWVVFGDIDYAKRPTQTADAAAFVPFERLQSGGGVNYLPWPFLRTRLVCLYNRYLGASATSGGATNNYFSVEYSAGIEF